MSAARARTAPAAAPVPGGTPPGTGAAGRGGDGHGGEGQGAVPPRAVGPERSAAPRKLRFAALGDSLTEGLGDPAPGGGWRGWAALLAAAAGPHDEPVELVNLSRSGALAADVAEEQLIAARRARPHMASVVVGGNDTLRDSFDIHRVAQALDTTIGALRSDGVVVLTACLPDPGRMLGLPSALARPLGRRMRAVNTVVHALSQRYEAVHVELGDHAWAADRRAWSVDRLHPSELGHRLLAREFHTALSARGIATGEPPPLVLDGPAPSRAGAAWWLATRGTRWVADRCTDLLPGLIALAALEWRHRLRGTGHLLETRDQRATLDALASVTHGHIPGDLSGQLAERLPEQLSDQLAASGPPGGKPADPTPHAATMAG
ncbi:SGNH/GDSL hydrolase family protein [Streptomyces sp. NPDC005336]|uniref:SGNH/GDSL hydrolase family protein n=1 Tax=Streptomyces sp. NPDC005336 TaxID=3157035 RepID=UPI0033BB9B67